MYGSDAGQPVPSLSHGLASIAPIHSENPRPFVIGMARVGQHHSDTFGKSTFPSSQKGTYSQNMGVLKKLPKSDNGLKLYFHYSSSSFCRKLQEFYFLILQKYLQGAFNILNVSSPWDNI